MEQLKLDTPLKLKSGTLIKNRFLKSATSEQLGDKHHNPSTALSKVYRRWSKGGTGLSISGNIMIDRNALGEPNNVVLDEKSDLDSFKAWTKAGTENGMQFWAQLNHPGKQSPALLSKEPVAPSAIAFEGAIAKGFNKPRALTEKEIVALIKQFSFAASLAKLAGFSGVQIHGGHGYLVSQFLSPRHNQRTDQWGGSMENRMRFILETYKAVRAAVGENFPIGIKLNSADFQKGGFTQEESMQVVKALSEVGIDLIEISGGTYEAPAMVEGAIDQPQKESTKKREAYFLSYAEKVRKISNTPLAVTGGFRSSEGMRDAISSGATDMVGLARPLILYPDLPNNAIKDASYKVSLQKPTTGIKIVDTIAMLPLTWFAEQIHRMGKEKEPNPKLSVWKAVWNSLRRVGSAAFKPTRA